MTPRLNWAAAEPWLAALRYHFTASAPSCATPCPSMYMAPSAD